MVTEIVKGEVGEATRLRGFVPASGHMHPAVGFARARVRQSDVFEGFDEPFAVVAGQHRLNQSVHRMWSCWMPSPNRETTPEVHNGCSFTNGNHIDHLVFER